MAQKWPYMQPQSVFSENILLGQSMLPEPPSCMYKNKKQQQLN